MHYEWHELLGEFDVPWQKRGDEWISHAMEYMTQNCGVTGYQSGGVADTGLIMEITVSIGAAGHKSDTRLLLLLQPDNKVAAWACGNDAPNDALVAGFRVALNSATEGIRRPTKSHKWSAIISEAPSIFQGNPKRLSSSFSLPGLKLTSTERSFWQHGPTPMPSINSRQLHASIPILVRGTSVGYNWHSSAQRQAAETLGLLVSFLSVIWNTQIDVQEAPAPLEWGERRLPDQDPWMRELHPTATETLGIVDTLTAPEWIEDAWILMNRRARIKAAISIYMEGLRVEDRHPSLALVAYISAVESISLTLFHEERCKSCSNHMHIGNKFLETLKLVIEERELEVVRSIYGSRSTTVHKGKLHGPELTLGTPLFSMLSIDPTSSFKFHSVSIIKKAARQLLVMALRNQLPGRTHYAKPDSSS